MSIPVELYRTVAQFCNHDTRLALRQVSQHFKLAVQPFISVRVTDDNVQHLEGTICAILAPASDILQLLESLSVYAGDTLQDLSSTPPSTCTNSIVVAFPTLVPMPRLKRLDLVGHPLHLVGHPLHHQPWSIQGASVQHLVENAPNLEHLALPSVNDAAAAVRAINRGLSKLRSLSMVLGPQQTFASTVKREGVKVDCPLLQVLHVANYHDGTAPVKFLVKCTVQTSTSGNVLVEHY
jgi:hypothetical protein